jgi:cytochrome c
MSSIELNKIVGAILFAGLVTTVGWLVSNMVYDVPESHAARQDVTEAAVTESAADEAATTESAADEAATAAIDEPAEPAKPAAVSEGSSLGALLAAADAVKGKKTFKKCAGCHTVDDGGKARIGPNLWDIVGRAVAAADGFSYSKAMAEHGGAWDFATLAAFLADPKGTVPGTKMGFKGVKRAADRADLLLYLRGLSESPAPLPPAG